MVQTIQQFVDDISKLDEKFNGIELYINHWTDDDNSVTLLLETGDRASQKITGEEMRDIAEVFGVSTDEVEILTTDEPHYLEDEDDSWALTAQILVETPEKPYPVEDDSGYDSGEIYCGDHNSGWVTAAELAEEEGEDTEIDTSPLYIRFDGMAEVNLICENGHRTPELVGEWERLEYYPNHSGDIECVACGSGTFNEVEVISVE